MTLSVDSSAWYTHRSGAVRIERQVWTLFDVIVSLRGRVKNILFSGSIIVCISTIVGLRSAIKCIQHN